MVDEVKDGGKGTLDPSLASVVVVDENVVVADQRTFLEEIGMSNAKDIPEADLGAVYDKAKAALDKRVALAAAPKPPKLDDAKAYLTTQGKTAEDIAKLSEADVLKAYAEAKKVEADKPVTYGDFNTSEGIKLDEKLITDFKAMLGPLKVPQDVAQKFVDMHIAQLKDAIDAPYKAWKDLQTEWVGKIKADPELGGAKFDEVSSTVAKVIDHIAGKDAKALRGALDMTGAGNNPEMYRFIARVGKILTEGGIVLGGGPGEPNPKNPAETLYPNQGKAA